MRAGQPPVRSNASRSALPTLAERWLPDAFIFALLATVVAVAAGIAVGGATSPAGADIWGKGFWSLIPFTMQMALIVITGTVVATAAPVQRLLDRPRRQSRAAIARPSSSSRSSPCSPSWFNWGFSLVFSARAGARRGPTAPRGGLSHARRLLTSGLGSVWAQGLSGSAALQMATPGMLPEGIRDVVANGGGAAAW